MVKDILPNPKNVKKEGKTAKPYQVKLVLKALDKLEVKNGNQ